MEIDIVIGIETEIEIGKEIGKEIGIGKEEVVDKIDKDKELDNIDKDKDSIKETAKETPEKAIHQEATNSDT